MRYWCCAALLALLAPATEALERWYRPEHAALGAGLYRQHCASCHGPAAEGAPGWQQPGPDGRYPPPPLNGSAHAWHHPLKALYHTITRGQGNMPAWGGRLSRAEVLAIIAWFQSLWPDEIYAAWQRMDAASG
ncbi:MAG: hypothetical protein RLZ44_1893 [Pseudomonadota bacterium]